uniref:CpsB/CapC family capsule biosynthesis tyrosine phosphatase n=1 Tax=uncultured Ruminococcus sp. TaxID=165186 RepID=UPI003459C1F4
MALLTEYHCHILPGIDDGSDSVETSLQMIKMMKKQGVQRICATPHFYAHREKSVAEYLKKRQAAFEQIQGQ